MMTKQRELHGRDSHLGMHVSNTSQTKHVRPLPLAPTSQIENMPKTNTLRDEDRACSPSSLLAWTCLWKYWSCLQNSSQAAR